MRHSASQMHTWVPVPLPWEWATRSPPQPPAFYDPCANKPVPPSSVQSHKTELWGGGDFAKPLGNKRGPGSLELEQGRGEGTSVGEGKRESSDPRESWGWGGGVLAWIFQAIKFQSSSSLLTCSSSVWPGA